MNHLKQVLFYWLIVTGALIAGSPAAKANYCVPTAGPDNTHYIAKAVTTEGLSMAEAPFYGYQPYVDQWGASYLSDWQGETFGLEIQSAGGSSYYFYCWVDWNNDMDFDDAGETLLSTTVPAVNYSGTLTIPGNASVGRHRIRIAMSLSSGISPCGPNNGGNFVDASLFVEDVTCRYPPTNPQVSNITQTSAKISWSSGVPLPTLGFEYYISTSPTPPDQLNTPPTGSTTDTFLILTNLMPGTTYCMWFRSDCGPEQPWIPVPVFSTLDDCSIRDLRVTGITNYTAEFNYSLTGSNYIQYYYSTDSTPPTDTTQPTGAYSSDYLQFNIYGLSPCATYFVWMRKWCSGSYGPWFAFDPFTTLSDTVNALVYPSILCEGVHSNFQLHPPGQAITGQAQMDLPAIRNTQKYKMLLRQ